MKRKKEVDERKLELPKCLLENPDIIIFYNTNDYHEIYTFKEMEDKIDKEDEILQMI